MILTKQQEVLTRVLDCGICDLDLLEDIQYDLDDIVDELQEDNNLSLNSIFMKVFEMGAMDLQEVLNENNIIERINVQINERINELLSDEVPQQEFACDDELCELFNDYESVRTTELDVFSELTYYLNCQDTHVALENADFYRKYFPTELDEIEERMGWHFSNGRC